MPQIGKGLIYLGVFITLIGVVFWGLTKVGVPIGKLPGDIHVQKEKGSFYFPIVTCILVSIGLTILLNLFFWVFRR